MHHIEFLHSVIRINDHITLFCLLLLTRDQIVANYFNKGLQVVAVHIIIIMIIRRDICLHMKDKQMQLNEALNKLYKRLSEPLYYVTGLQKVKLML